MLFVYWETCEAPACDKPASRFYNQARDNEKHNDHHRDIKMNWWHEQPNCRSEQSQSWSFVTINSKCDAYDADVVDVDDDNDDNLRLATCSGDPINKLVPSFPKFALVPPANKIVKTTKIGDRVVKQVGVTRMVQRLMQKLLHEGSLPWFPQQTWSWMKTMWKMS